MDTARSIEPVETSYQTLYMEWSIRLVSRPTLVSRKRTGTNPLIHMKAILRPLGWPLLDLGWLRDAGELMSTSVKHIHLYIAIFRD